MKRSRRVVLTLMGSAAIGTVSMGLVPRTDCGPGNEAVPGPAGDCIAARPIAASAARRASCTAMAGTAGDTVGTAAARCSASSVLNATTGVRPPKAPASIFTPSTANAIGTSAPITPSRSTRSNAGSRRRPPKSTRCASNWSAVRSTTKNYLRRLKIPEAFWPLISESWHRDDGSLYGRLDLSFDGARPGKAAGIQRRYADLDLRGGGVPVDLARTGDRTQHHPEARRPVQFDP